MGERGCSDNTTWETVPWIVGKDYVFDDNNLHFARNDGPGRRLIFTADIPRPNLPLHVRIFNEGMLRYILPFIPSVNKYALGFSKHYESLLARDRRTVLDTPNTPNTQESECHRNDGQCSTSGQDVSRDVSRVVCNMEALGDIDTWDPNQQRREHAPSHGKHHQVQYRNEPPH
mmetsp:Transcript_36519/g.47131  ORF Transcript_36519/g.47131 Transcript_36519/m.47131 type:complete len:173 (-) Transcript_36519:165-683(-)